MKIIVCGSRSETDYDKIARVLDKVHADKGLTCVVNGACPYGGVDNLAQIWAKTHEVMYIGVPAEWKKHGKAAGPIRNKRMLDEHPDAAAVIAFPGGDGTADMIKQATVRGVKVWEPLKKSR